MKYDIDKRKTLFIDGPASVNLLNGNVCVFGAPLQIEEKMVIRQGKRIPFSIEKLSSIEVVLGEGASVEEVEEDAILHSWVDVSNEVLSQRKPLTVVVIGNVDSGKTSFCTFLVNSAVKNNLKTSIVDADLGQSDVGPPSTIGFSYVNKPVKDLFEVYARDAVFIGTTNPSRVEDKIVEGLIKLKNKILKDGTDFLVVNTDGWIKCKEAAAFKVRLIEEVAPNVIVGIQREKEELSPIFNKLNNGNLCVINSPNLIQPRSKEKRKILRELSYRKYLKGAKIQSFSQNLIKIEDSLLGSGCNLNSKSLEILFDLLGKRPVYSEVTAEALLIVLQKNDVFDQKRIESIENYFEKNVKVIHEGDEIGLLVGFYDANDHFLGIGILHKIDYKRRVLKVYTAIYEKIFRVNFGKIKLDKNFRETNFSTGLF